MNKEDFPSVSHPPGCCCIWAFRYLNWYQKTKYSISLIDVTKMYVKKCVLKKAQLSTKTQKKKMMGKKTLKMRNEKNIWDENGL